MDKKLVFAPVWVWEPFEVIFYSFPLSKLNTYLSSPIFSEMHLIMTGVVWRTQCQWWQITLPRLPQARARAKRPAPSLQVQVPKPPKAPKVEEAATTTNREVMIATVVVRVGFFGLWWSWLCPVSTFSEGSVNTRDYLKTRPKTGWKWNWSGLTTKSWVS